MQIRSWSSSLVFGLWLSSGTAAAEEFGGIEFPRGAASFADHVVSYESNDATGVEAPYDNAELALGVPATSTEDPYYVSLGNAPSSGTSSALIVEFVDNRLVDIEGDDLYVFEIGPAVEATSAAISIDGAQWFELGRIQGSTRGIDLSAFPELPEGALFRYVRLSDYPDGTTSSAPYGGPDIDAIGAIGADVSDEDGDGIHDDGDNCKEASNPGQENQDADPPGDACDDCPTDPNDTVDGCPESGAAGAGGEAASEGGAAGAGGEAPSSNGGTTGVGGTNQLPGDQGGTTSTGPEPGNGGSGGTSTGGAGTQASSGGTNGGNASDAGSGGTQGDSDTGDDAGCGCRVAPRSDHRPLGFWLLFGLVVARRARRQRCF